MGQVVTLTLQQKKDIRDGKTVNVPYQGSTYIITPYLVQHLKGQFALGSTTFTILPEVLGENRMEEITITV